MFRITFDKVGSSVAIRIEGRFVAEFAEEARTLISRRSAPAELIVDLSDVTSVDRIGEEVLNWLRLSGASFVASRPYALQVCECLRLPVTTMVGGVRAG